MLLQLNKKCSVFVLLGFICTMVVICFLCGKTWALDLREDINTLTVSTNGAVFEYTNDLTQDADVIIDVYKLADAVQIEGFDTYAFQFTEQYQNLEINGIPVSSLSTGSVSLSEEQWQELAGVIAENMQKTDVIPNASDMKRGSLSETSGSVVFDGLDPGLYMIIPHGKNKNYWSVQTDDAGEEHVVSVAESMRYIYSFSPSIVAVPTKTGFMGDTMTTAQNNGEWSNDAAVELKASVEPKYGSIQITKSIDKFSGAEEATFVFEIRATGTFENGDVYDYSNVAAAAFDDPDELTKTITVGHIRAGAEVQVREIYSGLRYRAANTNWSETQTVTPDNEDYPIAEFYFQNTMQNTISGGHGIQNHFVFEKTWINAQQTAAAGLD